MPFEQTVQRALDPCCHQCLTSSRLTESADDTESATALVVPNSSQIEIGNAAVVTLVQSYVTQQFLDELHTTGLVLTTGLV